MLKRYLTIASMLAATSFLTGCGSDDVPPAHKGRMFDKTGGLALWVGGNGFEGPVLGPGTYYTGIYPEVRMVDCAQQTPKEAMTALTKDGVQFSIDVYVTYRANCDDNAAVMTLLDRLSPEPPATKTITADQVYKIFIRPLIGEAVRIAVAPYNANDINSHRDEIFTKVKSAFLETLAGQQGKDASGKTNPQLVVVPPEGLTMNNLDFPDSMDKANAERATVAIERDKSLAEQDKIKVQIDTLKLEVARAEVEAQAKAKKIDIEGAALARNPEYYVRDVYYWAAQNGSAVTLPANPNVILQMTPKK